MIPRSVAVLFAPLWRAARIGAVAAFLVVTNRGLSAEKPVSDRIETALHDAEKLATAGDWKGALAAGDRLRTACREVRGELHPDTALAELFLGEVRDHLGERELAELHVRRALAIQEQTLPPDSPEFVTTLTRLAAMLKNQHREDEATGLLQRALDLQTRLHGDDADTADACSNLARVLRARRDLAGALPLFERALRIRRTTAGGHAPETLAVLQEFAEANEVAGNFAAAELATAERVAGVTAEFGEESRELAAALADWGREAEAQTHFPDAETRDRRALALAEKVSADDPAALAKASAQLGWCLASEDHRAEARPLLERALKLRRENLGDQDQDTATSEQQLGWLLRMERDYPAARPHFEQALAIREKALGPNAPATIESLAELGDLHWLAGDFGEAATLHEKRRYRAAESTGPDSEETAAATHALAIVYESAKRWTQATDAALHSLKLAEQRYGPADQRTLGELLLLSRICEAAGALEPALAQYSLLAAWFAQHAEAAPEAHAKLERSYAIALLHALRDDEAERHFRESRRLHVLAFGERNPETLRSIADLWTFFDETRQPTRALEVANELIAQTERAFGADAPASADVWERLGQLQLTLGDREAAMTAFQRALENRRRRFQANSAELLAAQARVAKWFEEARDFSRGAKIRTERLAAVQQAFAAGGAEVAAACGDLAMDYFQAHELAAARELFLLQLKLVKALSGGDSAATLPVIARLGDVAIAAGDAQKALTERTRLAAGCARKFGQENPEHGRALLLLGEAQIAMNDFAAAERSLQDALRILRAARPDDPTISRAACDLATADLRAEKMLEARRWTRDALAGNMEQDEAMAEALTRLGDAWSAAGDDGAAEVPLAAALAILTQVAGDQDEHTIALLSRVARLRMKSGRADAAALLERARAGIETLEGSAAPELVNVLGWLALAQVSEGRARDAQATAAQRVGLLERGGAAESATLAEARALRAWTDFCVSGEPASLAEITAFLAKQWPLAALARSFERP